MPSKGLTVLIVLFVVGSVFGLTQTEFTRDVPRFPPEFGAVGGGGGGGAPTPAEPGGTKPGGGAKEPGGEAPDGDPDEPSTNVRVTTVRLQKLSSSKCTPVADEGTGDFVRILVTKEGGLYWGSHEAGSYDAILNLMRQNADNEDLEIVVAPDHRAPWRYVHWVLEVAEEAGIRNVKLGGFPGYDEKGTLLASLNMELALEDEENPIELPHEDMLELPITLEVKEDGSVVRTVFEQEVSSLSSLFGRVAEYNGGYAEEFGGDYTRDVEKNPWVVRAPASVAAGRVLVTLDAARQAAVYTMRLGKAGDYPPRPE